MSDDFFCKELGRRIISERRKKQLSQEEFALVIPLDRTYLARVEKGMANPTIKILNKIARRLHMKLHELLLY